MIRWVSLDDALLLHQQLVLKYGGAPGLRDRNVLESALARPFNLNAYEDCSDICRLAAAHAFGITRSHPFIDGNKRAGFAALYLFLRQNGLHLVANQEEAAEVMLRLAMGEVSEVELSKWLRANTKDVDSF